MISVHDIRSFQRNLLRKLLSLITSAFQLNLRFLILHYPFLAYHLAETASTSKSEQNSEADYEEEIASTRRNQRRKSSEGAKKVEEPQGEEGSREYSEAPARKQSDEGSEEDEEEQGNNAKKEPTKSST
jgi:hypothetical protein